MKRILFVSLGLLTLFTLLFGLTELLDIQFLKDPKFITESTGVSVGIVGIFLLVMDIFLPVPSSIVMIGNGAIFGLVVGSLLSLVGGILSTCIGFGLGKIAKHWLSKIISNDELEKSRSFIKKWGTLGILVSRPIPLISETVAVMAGATGFSFWRLTFASFLGYLPASIIYALVGCKAVDMEATSYSFLLVILVASIVWGVGKLWSQRINVKAH